MFKKLHIYFLLGVSLATVFLTIMLNVIDTKNSKKHQEINSRAEYEKFLAQHPFNNRKINFEEWQNMPKSNRPDLAWEQDYLATMNPATGRPEPEKLIPILEMTKAMMLAPPSRIPGGTGVGEAWVERGPNNVGGRTRAMAWDPTTTDKVWAGGVTGGLWYNNDITSDGTWTKVDDFWDAIAVTAIAFDPNNANNVYVGTGEGFGVGSSRGAGIWKSTDGGSTWNQLSSTTDFYYVNDLVVNNEAGTSVVYAAVSRQYYMGVHHGSSEGLQRSTDGGSTWTQVMPTASGSPVVPADIEIAADGEIWVGTRNNSLGSGGGRVYSSTNGTTWTLDHTHSSTGRVELACAPSDSDYVYAIFEASSAVDAIKKTTNDGTSWTSLDEPDDADSSLPSSDFSNGQAWYNLIIQVDPNDKDVAIAGAINLFRTSNGGITWDQLSHQNGLFTHPYVHADQHQILFKPGLSTTAIFGNDGGVAYSTNLTSADPSFTEKNNGYNVTQFYSCAIHPDAASNIFLAGSQDNGTQRFSSAGINSTTQPILGDGGYCHFLQSNGNYAIGSNVYNNYSYSTNAGASFFSLGTDNDGSFINPSDFHDALAIQYSAKTNTTLKKITDIDGTPSTGIVSLPSSTGSTVTHIRSSEYTTATSTLFLGTSGGSLWKVENADGTPTMTNISGGSFPTGSISCVDLGSSENELIVTFSNYGVNSVWYSTNGGTTWASREGDLPDMPVRWALMNPHNNQEVILATEVGVWGTTNFQDASPNWTASNSGLANVRVDMFKYRSSDDAVIAATHGRGLFSSTFNPITCPPPTSLTATSIAETTADLGWTEEGIATTWEIEWGTSGFNPTGTPTISGITSNPYHLTGLTEGTIYDFYVRANCGSGDLSTWSGPYTFTTNCATVTSFPFTETFETSSSTLNCWTQIQEAGSGDWTYATGSTDGAISQANSGDQNARFVSEGPAGSGTPVTKLVSPLLDLSSLIEPQLKFYYGQELWTPDQNETKVYYSADGGTTWTEIAHYTANISSWTEETLALPNPSSTYKIAFEGINNYGRANVIDDVSIMDTFINWTGATNTDWATASNWSSGTVPTASTKVSIPSGLTNYPTATSVVTVNSVIIASGATLIAQSTFAGTITYNRNLGTDNWYLVSSPVSGETIEDLITNHTFATGTAPNIGIAPYDNTQTNINDQWDYQTLGSTGSVNVGQGYSVKLAAAGDISFTGTMNTNDVSRAIAIGAGNAFNLIGNPYTSYINSATFLTTNTSLLDSQTIWVWNQATGSYDTKVTANTFKIAPAQGFFVKCGTNGNVTFEEASQSHESTDTFQRTTTTERPEIKLVVTDESTSRYAEIYYLENATTGFDNGYDGELFGGVENNFEIYSHLLTDNQNKKYQIQSLPDSDYESMVIPIGIKAAAGKEITFSLQALNLPTDIKVFLEDRHANIFTRLDEVDSEYRVTLTENLDGVGRFYLHTSTSVLSVDNVTLNTVHLYTPDISTLRIVGLPQGSTSVKLFNLLGKQLLHTTFDTHTKDIALPKLATGMYSVQIETNKGNLNKLMVFGE